MLLLLDADVSISNIDRLKTGYSENPSGTMFISSMARKNLEKQRYLEKRNRERKRRSEVASAAGLSINGESSKLNTKGFRKDYSYESEIGHHRSQSAPLPVGPPMSSVRNLPTKRNFTQRDSFMYPENIYLEKEDNFMNDEPDEGREWYLNPVHRPDNFQMPFSELVKRKPLTASVMKATTDGTLSRAYDAEIAELPLDDFDMNLFKATDKEIYRNEIRKSLNLHSPFELQLAKLKQEKLKLEEAYLLQQKCHAELEETRGPLPRWYEIKTSRFTAEHRKHKNLLENSKNWEPLIDYRNSLIEASGRWENLSQ